jgi:hypothetical protein
MRRIINDDTPLVNEIAYVLSVELPAMHRELAHCGRFDRPDCFLTSVAADSWADQSNTFTNAHRDWEL